MTSDELTDACITAAMHAIKESSLEPMPATTEADPVGAPQLSPVVVATLRGATDVAAQEQARLLHLLDEAIEILELSAARRGMVDVSDRVAALHSYR